MGKVYATAEELGRFTSDLTAKEYEQAESLLNTASAKLRCIAKQYGKDLDLMTEDDDYLLVVKDTVINCVRRALEAYSNDNMSASQTSQSALGYSVSMTYLNAGQSLYYLKNELKDLGIRRQKFGAMEVYYFNETAD